MNRSSIGREIISVLLSLIATASAYANPTGGVVAAGSASINNSPRTGTVTIQQLSDKAIINWQTFSIGSGELTKFIQPSSTSAVLNRVEGGQTSTIDGTLSANGSVYLINGNGIVVGAAGLVSVNAFTASTRDIADTDFLSGKLHFSGTNTAGVQNLGQITALEGDVYLIGKTVDNEGSITALHGTVGLAAGDDVLIAQSGQQHVFIKPSTTNPVAGTPGVNNNGSIASVSAELKAARGNIYALAINNGGVIRATGTVKRNGHIYLSAPGGLIQNSGKMIAKADAAGKNGGTVTARASSFVNSGIIDASGSENGGRVDFAGGDFTLSGGSLIDLRGISGTGGSANFSIDGEFINTLGSSVLASGGTQGGSIFVGLTSSSDMIASGTLDASSSGGLGGTVQATGGQIGLFSAHLSATGAKGGGLIELGGDSKGATLHNNANSTLVSVDAKTVLDADAVQDGNGGHVVLWSDGTTQFSGAISAKGGAQGGNGGLAEISGKEGVGFWGTVDRSAPQGTAGTLLLDPANITISSVTSDTTLTEQLVGGGSDSPASGDEFGISVALSEDGTTELVGALGKNSNAGAAYLFVDGAIAAKLTQPGAESSNQFGYAVALSQNGKTALVGAINTNTGTGPGAAYVFNGTNYGTVTTLADPSGRTIDLFGAAVALSNSGTVALVGAINAATGQQGAAYIFSGSFNGGTFGGTTVTLSDPLGGPSDGFGFSVGLSGDGTKAIIGAPSPGYNGGTGPGAAYVYSGSNYGTITTLSNSGIANGAGFGYGVALSNDGSTAAAGAPFALGGTGVAYVYTGTNFGTRTTLSNPAPTSDNGSNFGSSISLSANGSVVLVGAPDSGYTDSGNTVVTTVSPGAAYIFNSGSGFTGTFSGTTTTLSEPGAQAANNDQFGFFVALSGDGSTSLVSAIEAYNSGAGAAFLFGGGGEGGLSGTNFSDTPASDLTIDAGALDTALAGGNVILQANNDITLASGHDLSWTGTGTLTLEAGESVLLNSSITASGGGELNIVANDTAAAGVVNADRSNGTAVVTMASGTDINVGTGNVTIDLNTGVGNTNTASGAVTLEDITAGNIQVTSEGTTTGSNLVLDGQLSASGTGTAIVLSALHGNLVNNKGSTALSASSGAWQIYLPQVTGNTFGGLDSGNTAVWDATWTGTPVGQAGDRYVFAQNPTLTVTAGALSKNYGDTDTAAVGTDYTVTGFITAPAGEFTDSASNVVSGSQTSTGSVATASVGSSPYAITQGTLLALNGYGLSYAGSQLTVNPATLTYTADAAGQTYGSANSSFTGTVTGFVNGQNQGTATTGTLSFASGTSATTNAGSYAIDGSGLTASSGNYVFAQAVGNATALTINPATLTYTANSSSRNYGSANSAFNGTITGFVNGQDQSTATTGTLSFGSSADSTSNVGSYAIDGSGLTANNGNYTFVQATGNATALTVNPATLTYTATAAGQLYGSSNTSFTGTVTGYVNGENQGTATTGTLSFTSTTSSTSNVGSYAIDGSGLTADHGDYTFVQAAANTTALTINPATLTYTANAATMAYGSTDPAFSGTVTGFVNGENQTSATTGTLSFGSTAGSTSDVGSYAIDGSGLTANNGNYVFVQATGNATAFDITQASLTITANDVTKSYGQTVTFTGTEFTPTGLQNGQTIGSVSLSSSGAGATANVGGSPYTITINSASGGTFNPSNYSITYTDGSLTVTPAALSYVADPASRNLGETNPVFTGTVSGLVNGDQLTNVTTGTLVFDSSATTNSPSGQYSIEGSGLTVVDGNYAATIVQAPANAHALTINSSLSPSLARYLSSFDAQFKANANYNDLFVQSNFNLFDPVLQSELAQIPTASGEPQLVYCLKTPHYGNARRPNSGVIAFGSSFTVPPQ